MVVNSVEEIQYTISKPILMTLKIQKNTVHSHILSSIGTIFAAPK